MNPIDIQLVIITGLSGSGKSVALKMLEDAGFFCVDNLPAPLLPSLTGLQQTGGYSKLAVSVDIRAANTLAVLPAQLEALTSLGLDVRLLFLEAKEEALLKRFSETRRRHPLSDASLTVAECLKKEREMLAPLRELGHRCDTSDLSANTLRAWVLQCITANRAQMSVIFQSFGFKHGVPLDADFVFDVRCLPNPYYDIRLRALTGKEAAVQAFLQEDPAVLEMKNDIIAFLMRWLPRFVRDNRHYLTCAIGCTGGQHRSVYLTECLAEHFKKTQQVLIRHRELP